MLETGRDQILERSRKIVEAAYELLEEQGLDGLTIRAVRAFYRQLDTTAVEEQLRAHLFDPNGRLPLPRGGTVPIVYIDDVPKATRSMAEGLWRKHRDVLRGPRVAVETGGIQQISIWVALKM